RPREVPREGSWKANGRVATQRPDHENRAMAPRHRPGLTGIALGVLCFATFVSVTQAAMSSIVLPDLKDEFGVTDDDLTWFVTAYILTFAAGTVVYGRLGDMYGTRRPMLFGMGLFAAAAFLTAAAPEFWPVVAGRAVMGMGATAVPALSIATIVQSTDDRSRGRALGAIVAMVRTGFAAGPFV